MAVLSEQVQRILPFGLTGSVSRIVGLTAAAAGFPAPLGAVCRLHCDQGSDIDAEVVGFSGEDTLLMPYGELQGIRRGTRVTLKNSFPGARVGESLLGRVIDSRGRFIDSLPPAVLPNHVMLNRPPTAALDRPRISEPLGTGVRAIDGLLTCGLGQRMGIFAGSGVGKSTLLGRLARSSTADVNVVVLIGERGREVREFLDRDLGPQGLKRSVVVVATGDEPALLRLRAAFLGSAVAEYFRDRGRNVLLMMDSVTRFALAQREIGLAAGEPPATRGYPPSVFERSGRTREGSITGLYTVLVEGDDTNEPIADAVRGILDGHIVLTRRLAQQGHFPAIDALQSISRSMTDIVPAEHREAALALRQVMAAYQQSEDLISIGAYQHGSNPLVDTAIQLKSQIDGFLRQRSEENTALAETVRALAQLTKLKEGLKRRPA
jgi:FliI/YscN family ATPase